MNDQEVGKITDPAKVTLVWKWKYTLVLLLNILYIVLFYYLMKNYS